MAERKTAFVTNNFEVRMLILLMKILPRGLRDSILDAMFPTPPRGASRLEIGVRLSAMGLG